jgi:6-phosphogluconolactonase
MIRLSVHATPEDAARETAERVAAAVAVAERERAAAHVSLAGGNTPRRAYELLGSLLGEPEGVDWWFGDERCVPPDDPESNFRLVRESLLAAAPIPAGRVHRIHGEESPELAARAYEEELRRVVPADTAGIPVLDVALLGLGEDGHTASLFPGAPSLAATEVLVLAVVASKPPPHRITLTLPLLKAAREVLILATGAGKQVAVTRVLAGPDRATPASMLADADVTLIVDRAAQP